jgi:hypothetical protein
MAKRVCSQPGCPVLIDQAGKCDTHAADVRKARGSREEQGYGRDHKAERKRWVAIIYREGYVPCARCGEPVTNDMQWHLDHTDDRLAYRGPSHKDCNNRAPRPRR